MDFKKAVKKRPSDFHTHLRSIAQIGERAFRWLVKMNCSFYRYVVVEPNAFLDKNHPEHQIETVDDFLPYRKQVVDALPQNSTCTPLFLIKLTPKTTVSMIRDAADAGAIGVKGYPEFVTTGASHGGISNFFSKGLMRCLEFLEERDLVAQWHPESPKTFCMEREFLFHDILERYARDFPKLRLFVEHITDRRTLHLIKELREEHGARVYGTITGHHLRLTLDDVLGNNDNHCWPCPKTPKDKNELGHWALHETNYLISITDSALWKWKMKHQVCPACAGVFNPAEIAIPNLVGFFEENGAMGNFENFTSLNGLRAYKLYQSPSDTITLVRKEWQVPRRYDTGSGTVTPFLAGQKLQWQIAT